MDCVFCKIVAGKLPAYKVYEDKDFISFLDIRPLTRGNALVVPKKHYRWVTDVPEFGKLWEVAKIVGVSAQKAFGAEWVSFVTLGLEVPHAHIRVVPRYPDDLHETIVDLKKIEHFSPEEMEKIASSMRQRGVE